MKNRSTNFRKTDAPSAPMRHQVRQKPPDERGENTQKTAKEKEGSSPIGHPKKRLKRPVKSEKLKIKVRQNMAHLNGAENVFAPGGDHIFKQMDHKITSCISGKRWYVSYYTIVNGKKTRVREYGGVNSEPDPENRLKLIHQLEKVITERLYNTSVEFVPLHKDMNTCAAIDTMIGDKGAYLKKKSLPSIKHHLGKFRSWLFFTNNQSLHPSDVNKGHILTYRLWLIGKGISNRTVNNNIREVASLFNYIKDSQQGIIYVSPCKGIKKLPFQSETHVSYTVDQFQQMIDYMKEHDSKLLFYIKLIAFAYLRTDEAKYLRIRDIDVPGRKILLSAEANKTNKRTFKLIQENIIDEFIKRDLSSFPDHFYLFSHGNSPGEMPVGENYFRKHFKKIKEKFGLSKKHTMYGFRHTSVIQLLEGGVKWHKAMELTGHERMESFQAYAQSLLGKQPDDHSHIYTVKL